MATPAAKSVTATAVKEPTTYQRKKMFAALTAPDFRLPGDTNGRSLDVILGQR
ncbi:hypothetical protein [Streptomyces sp. NPDC005181]|uniref:hypothetical protein n=1 Tax=Streptomyces sp. NPDC005181 TaxID=3156869 RepID=UPI0033AD89E4